MWHLRDSGTIARRLDPSRHRGAPDTPACADTRPPAAIRRNLIALFSSSSPLAFPLQNQFFSLHISPAPNPTSRRFHIAPRPPIIAITPPTRSFAHGPFQPLVSSHPLSFEAFGVTAMTLPSFSSIELEALMIIASLLVVAAAIVVILFSAIIGTGLARLLYLGARSCVKTILPNFVPVYQPIAVGHKGVKN
jgi:hypothetical protein